MKKTALFLVCLSLLGAACSKGSPATVDNGSGLRFIPESVDWRTDVGRDATVLLDAEGQPAIVYLGFKQILGEGEIADERPIYLAATPNVLLADRMSGDNQFWNLVGVAWQRVAFEAPKGDPNLQVVTDPSKPEPPAPNASAHAAVDGSGIMHVAWTDLQGVKYANDAQDAVFMPTDVVSAPEATGVSIAVDSGASPWIAYYDGNDVMLTTPGAHGWVSQSIGTAHICSECNGARTRVSIDGHGNPVVAYTDGDSPILSTIDAAVFVNPSTDDLGRAVPAATSSVVENGGGGYGISIAYDKGGTAHLAYYTAKGDVQHATGTATFKVDQVAASPTDGSGSVFGWSTGIATDDKGTVYITWYDLGTNGVQMSTLADGTMTPYPVPGAFAGDQPSIVVSPDAKAVWLAWYDTESENLKAAQLTSSEDIKMAAVSPSPVVSAPPPPAPKPECEPTALDLTAPVGASTAGFTQTCLAANADKPFTLNFDNQDGGVPHNVAVFEDDTATNRIAGTEIAPGPIKQTLDIDALKAGNYFYKCEVHPNMAGTLVIS